MEWVGRFSAWLFRKLAPNGVTWLLLICIILLISYSLDKAAWVPDSAPMTNALLFGLLFGIGVAKSRFRGAIAVGYHLLLAILLLCLWVGKVVPPLFQLIGQPFQKTLDLLNIHLLTMLDRINNWVVTLAAGNNIQDNGLFMVVIGLLGWCGAAWLAWAVVRRRQAPLGLLPAGLLLALNIDQSQQPVEFLWFFMGCAILLVGRTAMVDLYRSWDHRRVDYPDNLSWNWAGTAVGLCLVILLAARMAPLFGTPEGWKSLNNVFKQAQKRVEDTTSRLFGDVAPPRVTSNNDATPEPPPINAETPQMGVIGSMPLQVDALVMWVRTSDPPPPQLEPGMPAGSLESGPVHYWRSAVFGKYNGFGWEGLDLTDTPAAPPVENGLTLPGRTLLTQDFEIVARHGTELFAANQPVAAAESNSLASPAVRLRYVTPDGTPLVFGQVSTYTIQSQVANQATDVALRVIPANYPAGIAAIYLQLPLALPQRVRDLARRVVGDGATPFDKAVRIQDYLRLSYTYRLDVPPPPPGRDVVDYFLYDAPGGFCSYYSTAMAVMLRSQGVAARVASGYATGSFDLKRGAYRVTPYNAHAWVEVYFSGYGWIEFEPTAALERINYETAAGLGQGSSQPLPPRPVQPLPAWQTSLIIAVVIAIPLALFGLAFGLRARRRRLPAAPPERQAEALYLGLRRLLSWAGLVAPASMTPDEFLHSSTPLLAGREVLLAALEQATALYRQAIFSPRPPSIQEISASRRFAQRAWPHWLRLLACRLWQRARYG